MSPVKTPPSTIAAPSIVADVSSPDPTSTQATVRAGTVPQRGAGGGRGESRMASTLVAAWRQPSHQAAILPLCFICGPNPNAMHTWHVHGIYK